MSWSTAVAILVRPLVLVLLFGTAMWLGRLILRFIPSSRAKDVLTREVDWGKPSSEAARRSWFSVWVWLAVVIVVWGGIGY